MKIEKEQPVQTWTIKELSKIYEVSAKTLEKRCRFMNIEWFGNGYKLTAKQVEQILNYKTRPYEVDVIYNRVTYHIYESKMNKKATP